MNQHLLAPDYIFETSWEVCNKVGGIHTVISTKALTLVNQFRSNYILIGPDVWRDTSENPEFMEDPQLFRSWKARASEEGLHIHIGRWNIAGNPVAVIVDFQSFTPQKDAIFARFWEQYKLDSLSGHWDYIEPALFGYAAAKVIESFVRFHLSIRDKVVAQFHEWMTGTGLLYLKSEMPHIGTIFTTHATVLGRCLAGNHLPLYSEMEQFNPDVRAAEFGVTAKFSLEKLSARHADAFTTVSEITARECAHFLDKKVDVVTPNGFEDSFVPQGELFGQKREAARNKLTAVAHALFGSAPQNPLFVANSGRYEFKNKGIDLFIQALGKLSQREDLTRDIVALVLIPANHYGPRKDLQQILSGVAESHQDGHVLTHDLHDADFDPILKAIHDAGLSNGSGSRVKVMFVPCYLNGKDDIFDMSYYDLLIGMDLTVFPSYYEPWGYTPLESVAFHIPTVTTSLAGFGLWVEQKCPEAGEATIVIPRTDTNDRECVDAIEAGILQMSHAQEAEISQWRQKAFEVSRTALWKNIITYYFEAFSKAVANIEPALQQMATRETPAEVLPSVEKPATDVTPKWKRLLVDKNIPENLKALEELANNLWWCWNPEAEELFASIDPGLWEQTVNPLRFLDQIPYDRLVTLEKDAAYTSRLKQVYDKFQDYMAGKQKQEGPQIAYFSMEYGLHNSLKIYSGGLGILAGDYLKEASDLNVRMSAVGLLYRFGYFRQLISANGEQVAVHDAQDFAKIPAIPMRDKDGNWTTIGIVFPGRTLKARIWKVEVGRVDLYLLDTDFEDNTEADRSITHHLYGGGEENRFKQEMLLGIGGIRALRVMGVRADVYHCNEGHAAFIGLERLYEYIRQRNLTFSEALEIVRASSLFTTHTPVPAGHDSFEENMLRMYLSHYPQKLKISWAQFMSLGRVGTNNPHERFSMSFLAANLSQEVNGVSRLHGRVSQEILAPMWPGYLPQENHVGYVTNGVHFPTWTSKSWRALYTKYMGEGFLTHQLDQNLWNRIFDVPDGEIWSLRNQLRHELINYIKRAIRSSSEIRHERPRYLIEISEQLNPKILTIGFARRFATYKRAHLLFRNLDRLSELVNNPEMPVQFLFAGKAHPADKAGQDLIKMIVEISKKPEFRGKILFLQNYNMNLAHQLVSGVDVWLNTPTRPLEASGTSGEKVVMNGGLHFSVLDGWWAEGYREDAGWMLPEENTYDNEDVQNELDSEQIYSIIESEIAPLFYNRNKEGVPEGWVKYIKNSIALVASRFTTTRMFRDYMDQYYTPLFERRNKIIAEDYALAKELSAWKKKISRSWDSIEVLSVKTPDITREPIVAGKVYPSEVVLDLNELSPEDIGVECVLVGVASRHQPAQSVHTQELSLTSILGKTAVYQAGLKPQSAGVFDLGIRIFPKHAGLPHRQDFSIVRWI